MTPDDDDLTPDPQTAADDAADDAHTERWREERARGRAAVEHDAMCPVDLRQRRSDDGCQCGPTSLVARVRADERERAAGRVEALPSFFAPGPWITRDLKPCLRVSQALAAIREGES